MDIACPIVSNSVMVSPIEAENGESGNRPQLQLLDKRV